MINYRFDKAGFFSALVLMSLLGGTVLATILIVLIGGWTDFTKLLLKWLWGTVWVLLIVTVLVRITIYRYQMQRGIHPHKREGVPPSPLPKNPEGSPVQTSPPPTPGQPPDSLPDRTT